LIFENCDIDTTAAWLGSTVTNCKIINSSVNGTSYLDEDIDGSNILKGSATFNPADLADGAGETTTVTVTGAALGDYAQASFSLDLQGITLTAWVSAANTVSVRFQNETTGSVNLAEGTLRARVRVA
jgi:hypothetical protein